MAMTQHEFTVRFNAPAFLGNAEQSGQWRTPPFKAQLRQWWRVAYAFKHNFQPDVAQMRYDEGRLFGHAWLENDYRENVDENDDERDANPRVAARKAKVRMRLEDWSDGKLKRSQWTALERLYHPEAKKRVSADLYLGYGPVSRQERHSNQEQSSTLEANAAIQAGERKRLWLAYPEAESARIKQALGLMDRYGTVGGRSRNGWGSYALEGAALRGEVPLRDWRQCLQLDWPHALGRDDKGPLIWMTRPQKDWKTVMTELARLKIELRTQFAFTTRRNAQQAEARHWLSYPVTNHSVKKWGNTFRLPNSLRFKLRREKNGDLIGVIFHMPCLPPPAFEPNLAAIEDVWQQVHAFLDTSRNKLTRIKA